METIIAVILAAMAGLIAVVMFVQAVRGTHDLLSVRNFFLLGMIIFQLTSGTTSLIFHTYGDINISSPGTTSLIYTAVLTVFLSIFWLFYETGPVVKRLARRTAAPALATPPSLLLSSAAVLVVIGIVFRVVIGPNVPLVGILTDILGIGVLAGAAGLATWAWAPRALNPAVAIPAAAIILLSIGTVVFQTFGRRDVVGVMITILMAAYHSHWKSLGLLKMSYRLALIAGMGLFFLAAFSTVRAATSKQADVGGLVKKLGNADVGGGLIALVAGQNAAANSMWIIETRPNNFDYTPYHSVIYTLTNPIPRSIWPDKPQGLGLLMVRQARVYRYEKNYTMGAGMVGHIWNDNPFLSLVPYAIFFALACRFLDEVIRTHPKNPFFLLPAAAGLGDAIGIPRGEVGLFTFRAAVAALGAWLALRACYSVVRLMAPPLETAPDDADDPEQDASEEDSPEFRAPMAYDAPAIR